MKLHEYNEMMAYLLRPKFANGGPVRNIISEDIGKLIIQEYVDGASTVKLADKYGFGKDTINRYIKKNAPGILRTASTGVNQYNFDPSVIDEIKKDAKTMSRKEILEKYKGRISKKRLDKEKLVFGKVEESGRPRIPEGESSPKQVKRANRIRNSQGFDVSGTFAKNFHHIFPIGGLSELSAQDVMILDKKFNETLGGFNLQLNDIADKIGSMDLSNPNALKELNDLNAQSKDLVDRAKAKLPKNLKNAIGYIEYQPVFDENGTIFELSQVRKGVDKNPSALTKFGNKKFKDYTKKEIKDFKKEVKNLASVAEDKGMTLAANPFFDPKNILTGLGDVARVLSTPTVAATFAGTTIKENLEKGESLPEALADVEDGTSLLYPELGRRTVGQLSPRGAGILSTLGRVAANPFGRAARLFTPVGAGLTAVGLAKDAYERYQELEAMSPEERQELARQRDEFSFGEFSGA